MQDSACVLIRGLALGSTKKKKLLKNLIQAEGAVLVSQSFLVVLSLLVAPRI
jgi:hypothetical protein